ncbi:MAG: Dam family site-specific DNA-(adenine-N6)-methyltransferase [Bacteroidales bacterium]|nr:Dam family site-specific DNA-(adenine-N6)-methyltransferase [Bacteroidales bacterium]
MSKRKKYYRSPLFYVGDKYKLLKEIKPLFPSEIKRFIEPFTGGGSVFLNINASEFLLNDIDYYVYKIHDFLTEQAKNEKLFFETIKQKIYEYGFSRSYLEDVVPQDLKDKYVKTYFAKFNKVAFQKLKEDFNNEQEKDILKLYLLLIYGFNRMLRFNSKGKYNLPVGNVDFNQNVVAALNDYFNLVNQKNINFYNLDFVEFLNIAKPQIDDFVYLDPPYLITFSEYNKLWNEEKEKELVNYLDALNQNNIKFAISNVTHYKGKINKIFLVWAEKYKIEKVKSNYISYHDNSNKTFEEVLVMNYIPERKVHKQTKMLFDNEKED